MYQGISSLFFFQTILKVKQNNHVGNTMKNPICPNTHLWKISQLETTVASDIKDMDRRKISRKKIHKIVQRQGRGDEKQLYHRKHETRSMRFWSCFQGMMGNELRTMCFNIGYLGSPCITNQDKFHESLKPTGITWPMLEHCFSLLDFFDPLLPGYY